MNEKDVHSQKLRTREGFGTRTPDATIAFPRVAIGGGTLFLNVVSIMDWDTSHVRNSCGGGEFQH